MYLTYDKYVSMGGKLNTADFAKAEAEAESLLDVWTLNRLKSQSVLSDLEAQGLGGAVSNATMAIIDRLDGIREARKAIASGQVSTTALILSVLLTVILQAIKLRLRLT